MAKPNLPPDLSPSMPAGRAAGKLIKAKIEEILACADTAMSGDVEGVHDLRVAAKRLREALRLFRRLLPRRRRRIVQPWVEQLNDSLGLVRDLDVLMEHARWVAEQSAKAELFVAEVSAAWSEERAGRFDAARALWHRLTETELMIEHLRDIARRAARRKKALNQVELDRFAYGSIVARATALGAQLPDTAIGPDPAALHRLRILVKRLKYTLEPFIGVLPLLPAVYKTVADVQEALGDAHDYDVLNAALRDRTRPGRPPSGPALQIVAVRQQALYALARQQVAELASETWYRNLLDAID